MSCTLWNNIKYKSFIDCLVDTPITVYDIKAANISVLFDKGLISPEVYNNLRTSAKIEREIYIGNLQGRNRKPPSSIFTAINGKGSRI